MKKVIVIFSVVLFFLILAILPLLIYLSFSLVKPTTEQINNDLERYFSKIVYIPQGIPRPIYDFEKTIYFWEMETPDKEVTGINFKYTPSFEKDQDILIATLDMPEKGDPSIFNKVMPAVVSDKQSLDSAKDPQKANLSANPSVGYSSIKLETKPETMQTIKIIWEFKKDVLPQNIMKDYSKLNQIPKPLFKFLYGIPHLVVSLFSGS